MAKKREGAQMSQENKCGRFRSLVNVAAMGLAVAIVVLTAAFLVPAVRAKDNPEDSTRVYKHTYDEVFQGAQEAVERMGCFVTDANKVKGVITGNGKCAHGRPGYGGPYKVEFEITIESVNANPETRVTIRPQIHGLIAHTWAKVFRDDLFAEIQKVLVTYK